MSNFTTTFFNVFCILLKTTKNFVVFLAFLLFISIKEVYNQ